MSKRFLLTIIVILFLTPAIFFFLRSVQVLFQEGSPWPQIKGIIQLNFGGKEIVKLSKNKYLTRGDDVDALAGMMKERGYKFVDRMGSGYFFKLSVAKRIIAIHKYYSRFYSLWEITEVDLVKDLRECLPKSDIASHERCEQILSNINNFDDCVEFGFAIMKSNPPQCATPEGRIFVQET
jgi:hypothetical protein